MKTKFLIILTALLALSACSTTSKLGKNDILYTGVKHLKYHEDSVKLDKEVKEEIFTAINVKPNNPLYSPYYRTPFPVGLWVYNHWDENSTGFKGWLYKNLVAKPVLISRVNPATRVDMINEILRNNGYFTSRASYQLKQGKNPKKAKVAYDVVVTSPYTIGTIKYLDKSDYLTSVIDSLAQANAYLKTGNRYSLDSLAEVRIDITNELRNRGYYFYRPEYIKYLADSVQEKGIIHLQLIESPDVPNRARMRYRVNEITAIVGPTEPEGTLTVDTVVTDRCTLIKLNPVRIKDKTIPNCIRARKGRLFRVNSIDRTQAVLSQLGIFSNIDIQAEPLDSVTPQGEGLMNLNVTCQVDKPWEVKLEVQAASKSNSFIGPGLNLGLTHKNALGAGEKFNVSLYGTYEWQTGSGGSYNGGDLNSYEFGLDASLIFPHLLAPKFLYPSRRYTNWTRLSLNGSIMNRPGYFKMGQLGTAFSWEWHATRHSFHELTPFKLTYNKLISTSEEFDSTMSVNKALYESFRSSFIPQLRYTYTYDRDINRYNHINFTGTVIEAGNLFWCAWKAAGVENKQMKLFGTPFSQFIKAQAQVVWTRHLGENRNLVGRVFVGAVHAYGNSGEVPYSEQFYAGGANSVRAFTVRTIGPGGYRPENTGRNAYYDQTGTFKFEANMEYRFPIFGYFKGAFFLDAGNVWLLKDDEYHFDAVLSGKRFFDQIALGSGLGLRFDMSMLVVRADLGVAIHAPYHTGKSGYYNIRKFKDGLAFHLAIGYPF